NVLEHWNNPSQSASAMDLSREILATVTTQDADDPEIDPSRAEELLKMALQVQPDSGQALNQYAIFLAEKGRLAEAEDLFLEALRQAADDPTIVANYAKFLYDYLGKKDEAKRMFGRAVEINPGDPTTLANFADVIADSEPERADELYERAVTLDPFDSILLGNYAILQHHVLGDPDKARALFMRA